MPKSGVIEASGAIGRGASWTRSDKELGCVRGEAATVLSTLFYRLVKRCSSTSSPPVSFFPSLEAQRSYVRWL